MDLKLVRLVPVPAPVMAHDHPELVRGASLITQDHRKIARVARPTPSSRDIKAALTLIPKGGEAGAHFCDLGMAD